MGIIPGMGAAVSQWVAYGHAVQSSPHRERFGKGAVEGVLGPGAANNSTLGGNLIPTIAFGVPGGVLTAILLGAFIIQGLVPGPSMLTPEARGGHLALTFSFVWTIVISNVITVAICFLFLRGLVKVTQVRGSLLVPPLLLLIYLGAFAEKHAAEDLVLVLLFGLLGWVMEQLHWPKPPLILGLVLGPLAENRLFLATGNYGLAWLARPGVLVLMAITLAGVVYPTLKTIYEKRERPPAPVGGSAARFDWSGLFNLLIVAAVAWALWESRHFNFRAGLFPWVIGFPLLALAIFHFYLDLGGGTRPPRAIPIDLGQDTPARVVFRRTADCFGWILGYLAAIWLLGFTVGGTLATFLMLKIGGQERWPIALAMSGGACGFTYGLFDRTLHVPFPPGRLWLWLGIFSG
jgi:hypothetical protein